jgi:hypothetical protein
MRIVELVVRRAGLEKALAEFSRDRTISGISIWHHKFATIVTPDDIDRFLVLLRGQEMQRWSAFS